MLTGESPSARDRGSPVPWADTDVAPLPTAATPGSSAARRAASAVESTSSRLAQGSSRLSQLAAWARAIGCEHTSLTRSIEVSEEIKFCETGR